MFRVEVQSVENLKGSRLLLPSVSIGNVGQLSVDLMINSFEMKKVGFIQDDNVLPVIGKNAISNSKDDPYQLSVDLEVYYDKTRHLTVLQMRSNIAKNKRTQFVKNLVQWIKKTEFKQVYLLSGADSSQRMDSQIIGGKVWYQSSSFFDSSSLNNLPVEKLGDLNAGFDMEVETVHKESLRGSGISRHLTEICEKEGISLLNLIIFTTEGDNIQASIVLASCANAILKLVEAGKEFSWRPPYSWRVLLETKYHTSMYL